MSAFLNQLRSGIGSLLGKDVGNLSEAELAQELTDAANKATSVTEVVEVAETSTSEATGATAEDNSALIGRIDNAEATVNSLQELVNAQTEALNAQSVVIKTLSSKVESLSGLTTVLTNKVVALNVGSVTETAKSGDPVTAAIATAEKDETVINMNMSDFMGIPSSKKS